MVKMPIKAKISNSERAVTALSFYSKQAAESKSMQKIKHRKKNNKAVETIKKLINSNPSSTSNTIKMFANHKSVSDADTTKKCSVSHGKIVPSATPELAKSDPKKYVKVTGGTTTTISKNSPTTLNSTAQNSHSSECNSSKSHKKFKKNANKSNGSFSSVGSTKSKKNIQNKNSVSKLFTKMTDKNADTAGQNEYIQELFNSASVVTKTKLKKKKMKKTYDLSLSATSLHQKVELQQKNTDNFELVTLPMKKMKRQAPGKKSSFLKLLKSLDFIEDSKQRGQHVFEYLIAPHTITEFFNSYFETNLLLIKRSDNVYFKGMFSTKVFDKILRTDYVEYTKNLDVTSYSDGVRQTHNPAGRVFPSVMWDYYSNGCSLRMLNPQTFHKPVWQLLATLQGYMGSFCGANMYLTPPATQGFAPHWDDIEAFVLQLEGKKRWRVYKPRNAAEVLPRYSSLNLSENVIGKPILDVTLEAGDLLYFPRGFIHQGEAVEDVHSLHITLSTYQKNAWIDLFEKICSPAALSQVASNSIKLREGLPLGCLEYMGKSAAALVNTNSKTKNSSSDANKLLEQRRKFKKQVVTRMVENMLTDDTIDRAMDEFARQFVRVQLPPCPSEDQISCTVLSDGERWGGNGVKGRVEIEPDTMIRLLGSLIVRVLHDGSDSSDEYRLYHSIGNSREYEGREEQFLVLDKKHLPAVHHLLHCYPSYISVEDLPLPTLEDQLTLATALWEQQLLVTEDPLNPVDDDLTTDDEHL
uniref:Bifunctional lysine-specific demethylase and histidyl-hydroxylase n=2 Tax=Hirondellea gigas TaxID=1518452 RepID=A0A2P2I0X5_9CRUS